MGSRSSPTRNTKAESDDPSTVSLPEGRLELLAPLLAEALLQAQYRREWIGANDAAALMKISRRRFDDLKRLGRVPEAERWVARKQVWNRLTIERLKDAFDQGALAVDISESDAQELRRKRAEPSVDDEQP